MWQATEALPTLQDFHDPRGPAFLNRGPIRGSIDEVDEREVAMSHDNHMLRNSLLAVLIGFLSVVITITIVLTLAPQ